MSAFGGKADIAQTSPNVCFLPKADIRQLSLLRRNGHFRKAGLTRYDALP
jgi:hypothetical protein